MLRELLKNATIRSARIFDAPSSAQEGGEQEPNASSRGPGGEDEFLVTSAPREDRREVQLLLLDDDRDDDVDDADVGLLGDDPTAIQGIRAVSFMVAQHLVQVTRTPPTASVLPVRRLSSGVLRKSPSTLCSRNMTSEGTTGTPTS